LNRSIPTAVFCDDTYTSNDVNNITGSMAGFSGLTKLTSLNLVQGVYADGISNPGPTGPTLYPYANLVGGSISGELPLWMVTAQMELFLASMESGVVNNVTLPGNIGSLEGKIPKASLNLSGLGLVGQLPASLAEGADVLEIIEPIRKCIPW
jgi:hypothetical protein